MLRSWKLSAALLGLVVSATAVNQEFAMGQEKPNPKLAFLDGKAAGADFCFVKQKLCKILVAHQVRAMINLARLIKHGTR